MAVIVTLIIIMSIVMTLKWEVKMVNSVFQFWNYFEFRVIMTASKVRNINDE